MSSEAQQIKTKRLFDQRKGYIEVDKFKEIFDRILVEKGENPDKYDLYKLVKMLSGDMTIYGNELIFFFTEFHQEWIEHIKTDKSRRPIIFPVMCGFLKVSYEIDHDDEEMKFIENHKPHFLATLSEYFGYDILDSSEIDDAVCVNIADYEALYNAYRAKFPKRGLFTMSKIWGNKTDDYLEKFRYWNTYYEK